MSDSKMLRARWAAIGAAVAVSLGAGGLGITYAAKGTGSRDVYTAIASCRVTDTRPNWGIGGRTAPLGPGDIHTVKVTGTNGNCAGIPGDVTAVNLNVTAIGATAPTHLTVWPTGNVPTASSLNPAPGQPPTPNAVTTKVHSDGTFKIFNNSGNVHILVDIVGYYQDHHHDDRYYSKAQVDQLLSGYVTTAAAGEFVERGDLTNFGVVRWGYIRDLTSLVEVYQDNEDTGYAGLSVVRGAGAPTGVYEVTVPGVRANGGYHAVLVSAQQGQTNAFRACKVFQTVSAGDPADTLVVRVRCYDDTGALANSDFNILVLH